ncbi:adenylate/guanylate cyclase domain-containing protein [Mycolicibacterium sp.]|uniref:adenylate/guanylate cyclase domain-containing protein n=1 Tax=Mycolicibacterium sp. TaxID=2320850 RepID=UPI001A298A11|nr:adenylate/guanylate cyclase domain-containing protein [Mycolicibacterium sp.]MBJ7336140.1 adenylate/guanylate cyclase domain-containing protein [Mycolicibacterium sp.]
MTVLVLSTLLAVSVAAVVTLAVLLIVTSRRLADVRRRLERAQREQPRRRRRPRGIAPFAIRKTWRTAEMLRTKGIGATVRNSIEDLAGWASVERPDLARLTADGDVVVVFSDIEGSTERNEALGDRDWVKLLQRHEHLVRSAVEEHRGHVVKNQGDGFMLAFGDPEGALRCCVDVQRELAENPERWQNIKVRMGIHMGPSVRRGDDLFGLNVAMAARVAGHADGGEILISEVVRDAIGKADGIAVSSAEVVEFKGFSGTYEVFPVALGT